MYFAMNLVSISPQGAKLPATPDLSDDVVYCSKYFKVSWDLWGRDKVFIYSWAARVALHIDLFLGAGSAIGIEKRILKQYQTHY